MYWIENEDGTYELMDGQQRTISFCKYVKGEFSLNYQYFHNLEDEEKEQILNYRLMIYFCKGTDKEKLEWFKVINTVGEKLTDQELRNAIYRGRWLTDAKRYFSKTGCPAYDIGSSYLRGIPIRQDYLETALEWISENNVETYMATHQNDPNANALWSYFQSVITWVKGTFTNERRFMKGLDWGILYNKFKDKIYDTKALESEIAELMQDDDVTKKAGIYPYILIRDEKYLSIRTFTESVKQKVYEQQQGICIKCGNRFEITEMEADHITPWIEGGKTNEENCQILCRTCNRSKSSN